MALDYKKRYPDRTDSPSADYPFGRARDVSSPGAGDGTPWQQDLVNDLFGFLQGLLSEAGVTPSESPDTAQVSQYLDAVKAVVGGDANLNLFSESYSERSVSGPITVDPADDGHTVRLVLTGDTSMTLDTTFPSGRSVPLTIIAEQDDVGGHSLTFPTATRWNEGNAEAPAQAAGAETIYQCFTHDGGNIWYAFLAGANMATTGS